MNTKAKESLTDLPVYASVRCITGRFEPPILGVLRTVQWSMYRRHMHFALIKAPVHGILHLQATLRLNLTMWHVHPSHPICLDNAYSVLGILTSIIRLKHSLTPLSGIGISHAPVWHPFSGVSRGK